ncbi:MAG: DUF3048 domain-containing protein [Acutalibacteraceae bacterium]|nr:DUF3048 domain-containing protein [Acutalibacteraceae bacterium]
MIFKRLFSATLAILLAFSLVACGAGDSPTIDSPSSNPSSTTDSEGDSTTDKVVNPLTGEKDMDPSAKGKKPVAVTVNNLSLAQKVQSGLDKADLVFETEVEGGITRLLAFFADPTEADKIGTVRSVRVPFIDIVNGLGGMLFYHGIDYDYAKPHLDKVKIPSYELDTTTYGTRVNNGLAKEHTLYTSGAQIDKAIEKRKMNDDGTGKPWVTFAAENKALSDTKAETISVPFSSSYVTQFLYDKETAKYARAKKGVPYTDCYSKEKEMFSNVFVLETTISNYPDGKHRKVDFTGGNGYYASNGTVIPIKWEKGASENNFSFKTADGKELTVNTGNSYICIVNMGRKITFE